MCSRMDSPCKRNNGCFNFKPNRPRFLKIIVGDTAVDGMLRFPEKFVRKYGNCLPNKVHLIVPTGAFWEIDLLKGDDNIWLENGWREFAKYYSVAPMSVLTFEYVNSCHFHVFIFDKSASEIDYPYSETDDVEGQFQEPIKEEAKDDVSVEVIDDFPPRRRKPKSEAPRRNRGVSRQKERTQALTDAERAHALERANAAFKSKNPFFMVAMQPSYVHFGHRLAIPSSFSKRYCKESGYASLCVSDGRSWSVRYWTNKSIDGRHRTQITGGWDKFSQANDLEIGDVCIFELTNCTEIISLKVVIFRAVEDENDHMSVATDGCCSVCSRKKPHFVKTVGEAAVKEKKLQIPKRFIRIHGDGLSNSVLLKDPSGAEWELGLLKCDGYVFFQHGWQEFADYYSLCFGYFLVFEYDGDSRFSVVIFDHSSTEIDYPVSSNRGEKLKEPKREENEDEDGIPTDFMCEKSPAAASGVSRPSEMMKTVSSRMAAGSSRKAKRTGKSKSVFPLNETQFSSMNIEDPKKEMINLGCSTKNLEDECQGGAGTSSGQKLVSETGKAEEALERARAFKSKNPFFLAFLKGSHVPPSNGCLLSIPQWFLRNYLKEADFNSILSLRIRRRSWDAKCFQVFKGSRRARLRIGWRDFAQDNYLKVGDVCVFELINRINVTFRVSVFRA